MIGPRSEAEQHHPPAKVGPRPQIQLGAVVQRGPIVQCVPQKSPRLGPSHALYGVARILDLVLGALPEAPARQDSPHLGRVGQNQPPLQFPGPSHALQGAPKISSSGRAVQPQLPPQPVEPPPLRRGHRDLICSFQHRRQQKPCRYRHY